MSAEYDPGSDDMQEQFVAGAMVTGFSYSRDEARSVWAEWLAVHDAEVAAKAWDEGFEAAATWTPFTPAGIPSDPPLNPYRADALAPAGMPPSGSKPATRAEYNALVGNPTDVTSIGAQAANHDDEGGQ